MVTSFNGESIISLKDEECTRDKTMIDGQKDEKKYQVMKTCEHKKFVPACTRRVRDGDYACIDRFLIYLSL